MISDHELIEFNHRGFIPGPKETEEEFLSRVSISKKFFANPDDVMGKEEQKSFFSFNNKVKKPRWSWVRSCLVHLFDFSPENIAAYFDNRHLPFFQGGATWILEKDSEAVRVPVIQVRKKLQTGSFFYIYTLEEILAHEAAHAARVAFDENEYEEIFAYWSSSSHIRRFLGPLFRSTYQVFYLFGCLFSMLFFQLASTMVDSKLLSAGYVISTLALLLGVGIGFTKLFVLRRRMKKALRNLSEVLANPSKSRFVLFRLTDLEIALFAKFSPAKILHFVKERLLSEDLRWRMIYLCYFS